MNLSIGEYIALGSLLVAVIVFLLNSRKDTRGDAAKEARIEAKLDNISSGVIDLRTEIRVMQQKQGEHSQRLSVAETEIASVKRRMNDLEHVVHKAHPPV